MNDNDRNTRYEFTHADTTRKNDYEKEKACADYVDKNWFSKGDYGYERVHDASRQFRGADVILHKPRQLVFDEKVKVDGREKRGLLGKVLSYPSFELLCKNTTGNYNIGWLLQDNSITTHIALISVFSEVDDFHNITVDNIDKLVYSLVDKGMLFDLVEKYTGLTKKDLKDKAFDLAYRYQPDRWYSPQEVKDELTDVFYRDNHGKAIYQVLRQKMKGKPEVPVNLVVRRDLLLDEGAVKDIEISPSRVGVYHFNKNNETSPYIYE